MSEIKRPVPGGQREDRKERGIKGQNLEVRCTQNWFKKQTTIFAWLVSAEIILFWIL